MSFKLMELPYGKGEFKSIFSAEMFDYHHGKHLQAYVDNTNKLIAGTKFENATIEEIVLESDGGLFNNAAQVFNHEFYFNEISPNGGGKPTGALLKAIEEAFGSFDGFKEEFSVKAATLFGAGWAWLIKNKDGKLEIKQYTNAATPLRFEETPLLNIDVWEHAYYVDYRNARPQYIKEFFNVINWDFVQSKF
ncbi:MAG: superoxide dismutase [Bacteroidetes bacterium 4572_77]|nr:MAG: superoxide dismutase [Bacteroidetes bacterium 4572_77]